MLPEHKDLSSTSYDEWEERVFLNAASFSVWEERNNRTEFPDFPAAALYAFYKSRALVYAITESGRSSCIPRAKWTYYLKLWKQFKMNKKPVRRVTARR